MGPIGFSTGPIAHGDYKKALDILAGSSTDAIELSALRLHELGPLVDSVNNFDLSQYSYISVHAPGAFDEEQESFVVDQLTIFTQRGWPVIVHPNAIFDFKKWKILKEFLFIENMDKRKPIGRSVNELGKIFFRLPEARLCFDIAHARQFDTSMTEAYLILKKYRHLISQIHISEVGTKSGHVHISSAAIHDYREVSNLIPKGTPMILEVPANIDTLQKEINTAIKVFRRVKGSRPEKREQVGDMRI